MPIGFSRIHFTAGPRVGATPLEISPSSLVLLVGPNNSGKSLALRELESWCEGEEISGLVISELQITAPESLQEAEDLLDGFRIPSQKDNDTPENLIRVSKHALFGGPENHSANIEKRHLNDALKASDQSYLRKHLMKFFTIRLDGRNRFELSTPRELHDPRVPPKNHLMALLRDENARSNLRRLTFEAFGLYCVIDPTRGSRLFLQMCEAPPKRGEELGLEDASIEYHSRGINIDRMGDGVQAYVGLLSAILSLPQRVLLIDEPDAFLHPPLARRLGRNLCELMNDREGVLIAATHSSDFVLGALETEQNAIIVRLSYEGGIGTARQLNTPKIKSLMLDPMLRSTKAFEGLFHRAAIVVEGDSDRVFYEEINRRLIRNNRGTDDALFINAQNWQTIYKIIDPLRNLGIPAAATLDFDTLSEFNSSIWNNIYSATNISGAFATRMSSERVNCAAIIARVGRQICKVSGLSALNPADKSVVESHLNKLAQRGIFIVPVGEVEHWLGYTGLSPTPKKGWIIRAFSILGNDPSDSTYLSPARRDVWGFLDRIGSWTSRTSRLGMS